MIYFKNAIFFIILLVLDIQIGQSQVRSMIDAPSFFATSKDLLNAPKEEGIGLEIAYGLGTHHLMAKIGVGLSSTFDFKNSEFLETLYLNPYIKGEIGAGMWRSNGQKCSKTNANAFTVLPKIGARYNLGKRDEDLLLNILSRKAGLEAYAGLDLAFFYIRDYRKNTELFLSPSYFFESEKIELNFGIRLFINTRA